MKFIRFFLLILLAAAIVYFGPALRHYTAARAAIPPGVTLGGANIGGETAAAAAAQLRELFESPVLVFHGQRRILLRPDEIGYRIEAEAMIEAAQASGRGFYFLRDFIFYLLDRPPLGNDIPLQYSYDRARLGAWLQAQADAFDNDPAPAYAKLDTLTFVPGQPGRYTNLNESAIDILRAFNSFNDRTASLTLLETPALPPDYTTLEAALSQRLERYGGIYSLYFQDLHSGAAIDIDGDTAFAGMSTVKLPILLKLYYDFAEPLPANISNWISDTVKSETASNAAANALMYHIGGKDTLTGARRVSDFVHELGFANTFIAIPYDSELRPPAVRTPANTAPAYNTFPDPAMQTTPRDIGELLAEIGQCAEGRGNLLAAYPDRLTQTECQELVGWLAQNPMGWFISYGIPADARIGHKHGYGSDTHGDVAIIYGPEGPYVLSIFVYQYGWAVWELSNPLMIDLSRLIWNFYLARSGQEQLPPFTAEQREAMKNPG